MGSYVSQFQPGAISLGAKRGSKARLASIAMETNRPKILAAPLTVIIGHDQEFPDTLPQLFPSRGEAMRQYFSTPGISEVTAFRNGSLHGAYLILAARALGLDCGPMSGFDNAAVDMAFFAGTRIQSNFICCLGVRKAGVVFSVQSSAKLRGGGIIRLIRLLFSRASGQSYPTVRY